MERHTSSISPPSSTRGNMRQRPWPIVILAILHFFAGIFNVVLHALISPLPFAQELQRYALPGYRSYLLFYVLAPAIAGVAIYICKKWSFWLYLAMMILISIESFRA